jgi:predicted amidohydrolase
MKREAMHTTLSIGCYQFGPKLLEIETNLSEIATAASDLSADLAVFPELASSGYFFSSHEDVRRIAETIPNGPTTRAAIEVASSRACHVVIGLPEIDGDKIYNSAVLVGPDGYIGRYRKTHLFYEEKIWFSPGDTGFPIFDVVSPSGVSYKLGIMICFDWFFPESTRTLAARGADVIAHPSNLVKEWCPTAMPIRALENHVFTATANRIGAESNGTETLSFIGSSLICGPDGTVRARTGRTTTDWIEAPCDLEEARDKRVTSRNEVFSDRRPDTYVT